MIGKIKEIWRARQARKAREKRLGEMASAASREKYPEQKIIWSPWILEDEAGFVVGLFYQSNTRPVRRRFWQISGEEVEEADSVAVKSRFELGAYR